MKQFWIYWILAAFETSNWKCPVVHLGIWVHGAGKNYVNMRQSGIHCSEGKIVTGHFVAWQYLLECRASSWEDDGPSWPKCIILSSFATLCLCLYQNYSFFLLGFWLLKTKAKPNFFSISYDPFSKGTNSELSSSNRTKRWKIWKRRGIYF